MFFIRADGNAKIGAGHLMRCMTIAGELSARYGRESVCFVCADAGSGELAGESGFQARVLGTEPGAREEELPFWPRILEEAAGCGPGDNVILVDSYSADDRYLEALGRLGHLALMDDTGERRRPVECVVNYNAQAREEHYRELYAGSGSRLLVGSRYVPVRPQFLHRGYQVREQVREVLITAGGGDSQNLAGRILERLLEYPAVFHVVTGRFHPHQDSLDRLAAGSGGRVLLHHDVKDMAGLMGKCDLAVTAGGSTVYELAVMGVPFVCFSCADNQEPLTDYLGEQGIVFSAGPWHRDPEGTQERLAKLFCRLADDREGRMECHLREKELIDGKGAQRLAVALGGFWR